MKSKCTWIFTLLMAFFIQFSFAQDRTITGVVSDATGLPVPGATVKVENTNVSTMTDIDGKYSIKAATGQNLVFSFVGMQTVKKAVGNGSTLSVKLEDDATILSDVVVEGYRTTSRATSNVSVTTITAETIESRPNVSFVQSLQGQIPGLNISTGSGSPGSSNTTVLLRGLGSLNGNTEPLYVIDGVPTNGAVFRSINSNDIESVSVLKDAGATAVYGNRGANGVIVIKTKRGKFESSLLVRYTGTTGFTTLQDHNYRMANSSTLLRLERDKGVGLGATGGLGGNAMTDGEIDSAINTNWEDVFFTTGLTQEHNLSFTLGSKNTNSFISLGYFEQDGIVPSTDIKRLSFRANFSGKSSDERFNYNANSYLAYSRRNQLEQETRSDINGNVLQNPLQGMLSSLPYLDPAAYQSGRQLYDEFGAPTFDITPYMLMDYMKNIYNRYDEVRAMVNGSASYKLTNDLVFSGNAGVDYLTQNRVFARLPQSYLAITSAESGGYAQYPGLEQIQGNRDVALNTNLRLNYKKVFADKHTFDVALMTEYYKGHFNSTSFSTTGLDGRTYAPGAGTGYIPFSASTPNLFVRSIAASMREAGLFSYFGTLDYDYDNRFGIGATIRRDATFRFIDENQWGTFWSVSGRWNLDQEAFLQNTMVTELKLRASVGTTGNQLIGTGTYDLASVSRTLWATSGGYGNQSSFAIANIGNPTAKWETTLQYNVGVDFVLNKRISGSFDAYYKLAQDMYQDQPISAVNGVYDIRANLGDMENKGLELLLNYDVFKNSDFNLRLTANGSYNKNSLKNVPNGSSAVGSLQIQYEGEKAFQYFAVPYVGVNPVNGNSLFLAADGSLTESPVDGDRRRTGKSPIPVYQGGFGFEASYKGFFASTQFTFVKDVDRFDSDLNSLMDSDNLGAFPVSSDLTRAWTPNNVYTDIPSLSTTNSASIGMSDKFLRDASYLRLKYASIGYNVPKNFLERTAISNAKVYVQAENFLTWTKWRGFDPESNAASTFGGYPTPRVFSFGVDVSF